jgi:lysylphosphatidylglycerol synthetase-like protein (DUF2156 family)
MIVSLIFSYLKGWSNEIYFTDFICFQPYCMKLQIKPITILLYSFLGFVISILLLLRDFISKIPSRVRLAVALFSLIPEAIYLNELLWHFFFWLKNDLVEASYFVFHTKLNGVLLFAFIALQIMLLSAKQEAENISKN